MLLLTFNSPLKPIPLKVCMQCSLSFVSLYAKLLLFDTFEMHLGSSWLLFDSTSSISKIRYEWFVCLLFWPMPTLVFFFSFFFILSFVPFSFFSILLYFGIHLVHIQHGFKFFRTCDKRSMWAHSHVSFFLKKKTHTTNKSVVPIFNANNFSDGTCSIQ